MDTNFENPSFSEWWHEQRHTGKLISQQTEAGGDYGSVDKLLQSEGLYRWRK